jgi:thymidine phosphorylase
VAFLRGEETSPDLAEVARDVAVRLLQLHGASDAEQTVADALESGAGYDKFADVVRAQGGDAEALADLPVSPNVREVTAAETGYVASFDALGIARASLALGAGREKKEDAIDPGAGVEVMVSIGESVDQGQPVALLYGTRNIDRAADFVRQALVVSGDRVTPSPHVLDTL